MKKREFHGDSNTPLYKKWHSMTCRVLPTHKKHKDYYDRGITLCDEWKNYTPFKAWALSNGYTPDLEIDRRDNDKGYSPDNCRFVPFLINIANRRNTIMIDYRGENIALSLLCNRLNKDTVQYNLIRRRLKRGWDIESAIDTPASTGNRYKKMEDKSYEFTSPD